jgi:hypothetical protein
VRESKVLTPLELLVVQQSSERSSTVQPLIQAALADGVADFRYEPILLSIETSFNFLQNHTAIQQRLTDWDEACLYLSLDTSLFG